MSAETVARWNAIPLSRASESGQSSMKRPRDNDADDESSEDNISLVSRTPSPVPDVMDVDKYDEYYHDKPEPEVITVETKIKSTNIGFSMLAKMGWVEGAPLGLSGEGRVDPVPFYIKNDLTGLGKANQDVRMIESTVSQRREMDSERQTKETEEQRRQRENAVAKRAAVHSEISAVLRPFYCEVCEKQFQNVAQYDEHTNSYAHHHKVRFRDMQAAQRASRNTEEEVSKRKEKERKREEKELRKIAKAAGVKMVKPVVTAVAPSGPSSDAAGSSGFKKSGWAAVATAPVEPPKTSGWATVGEVLPPASNRGGWASVSAPPPAQNTPAGLPQPPQSSPQPQRSQHSGAPAFRTGGWTSLETSTGMLPPSSSPAPPPPPPSTSLPLPPANAGRTGWATVSASSSSSASGGWGPISPAGGSQPTQTSAAPPPVAPPSRPPPAPEPLRQENSRSGWQKFRAGAPGRRR